MVNVYMETYGCSANHLHSEVMLGVLKSGGCEIVGIPEIADVLIINTCIVKEPTEKKIIYRIQSLRKKYPNKKIIVAGCMPAGEYDILKKISPDANLLGPNNCLDVLKCVKRTLDEKICEYLDKKMEVKLCRPKIRFNDFIDIVEISQGCLGNCTYCIVKNARGELKSYHTERIIKDIEMSLDAGCKEIWLTSQDCGCYGRDIDVTLIDLLKNIEKINGKFRVRIGMMNPNHVLPILNDLIECYKSDKIYKFLHIPVQSGSNNILMKMNRSYNIKNFKEIVKKFRETFPDVTLWTDVIVGFPGESEKDFNETIGLLREIEPDFVNVSKFGARPGTEAEKMEQLDADTIKERSKIISELVGKISLEKNGEWIGKDCVVLITKKGKNKNQYIGRNETYKSVLVESEKDLRGKFIKVKITDAAQTHLFGIVI